MDTSTVLLHLSLVLITARIFSEVAAYIKIPPVIGELTAGIFLGPSLLALVEPEGLIRFLGEVGIILLLFQIGLETDLDDLVKAGLKAVTVALGGFIFPFILVFYLSYSLFNLALITSLFIAGTMTATSIGVTMRTLTDLGHQKSKEGQIVLGAAVLDDILGVLLLAIIFKFSQSGSLDLAGTGRIALFLLMFFLIAPVLAKVVSFVVRRYETVSKVPGIIPTSVVSLVLFFGWISHIMGVPELLGGFATGLALSRRFFIPFGVSLQASPDFSKHIKKQMRPIIQLLTPIFFVMVGLSLDLKSIDWTSSFFWMFSISLLIVAAAGKFGGAFFIKENWATRTAIGLAMIPRGEVGLVFAELGRLSGVFEGDVYATVIIVIAYTTLFTPYWLNVFYRRYGGYIARDD